MTSRKSGEAEKKWNGKETGEYSIYREQLISWALGKGRRFRQVLLGTGKLGKLKYQTMDDDEDYTSESSGEEEKILVKPEGMDAEDGAKNKASKAKPKRSPQSKYNRISEKLYSRMVTTLGSSPMEKLIARGTRSGDARHAYLVLEKEYGHADPLDLPALFLELVTLRMDIDLGEGRTSYDAYTYRFNEIVKAIDSNPLMSDWRAVMKHKEHTLPSALLNALFTHGLTEDFDHFTISHRLNKPRATFKQTVEAATSFKQSQDLNTKSSHNVNLGKLRPQPRTPGDRKSNKDRKDKSRPAPGSVNKPCHNWQRNGTCRFGDKCMFQHEGIIPGESTNSTRGSSNLTVRMNSGNSENNGQASHLEYVNPDLVGYHNEAMDASSESDQKQGQLWHKIKCYYGIYNGAKGFTGIVDTWEKCQPKVKHRDGAIRNGVKWKKFRRLKDAEEYLYDLAAHEYSESGGLELLTEGVEIHAPPRPPVRNSSLTAVKSRGTTWVLDTGTNIHLTGDHHLTKNFAKSTGSVRVASGEIRKIAKQGSTEALHHLRCLPQAANLISVGQLVDDYGVEVLFTRMGAYVGNFSPKLGGCGAKIGSRGSNNLYHTTLGKLNNIVSNVTRHRNCNPTGYNGLHPHRSYAGNLKPSPSQLRRAKLVHDRLGHIGFKAIAQSLQAGILQADVPSWVFMYMHKHQYPCRGCAEGKHVQNYFRKSTRASTNDVKRATRCLQRLHIDICIVNDANQRQYSCFLLVIDEFSRYVWVRPLRHRRDAPDKLRRLLKDLKGHRLRSNNVDNHIEIIRSDGAQEFVFGMEPLRQEGGIQAEVGAPHRSCRTNPFAERGIRTICQMARCMMVHSHAPLGVWDLAVAYAAYLYNRLPHSQLTRAHNQPTSPSILFHGNSSLLTHLTHARTFYAPVFAKHPNHPRGSKFTRVSSFGRFVGISSTHKGYLVLPRGHRLPVTRRDVHFYEDLQRGRLLLREGLNPDFTWTVDDADEGGEDGGGEGIGNDECPDDNASTRHLRQTEKKVSWAEPINKDMEWADSPPPLEPRSESEGNDDAEEEGNSRRRSTRDRRPNVPMNLDSGGEVTQEKLLQGYTVTWTGYGTTDLKKEVKVERMYTPSSYNDAISCDDRVEWTQALQKEYKNFFDNEVVEVVERPKHANVIKNLLLFRNKKKANGTLDKRKVRLCARGDTQRHGQDYDQTFAPTVHSSSLKLFLHLITKHRMKCLQCDVPAAFLKADIDRPVYMEAPPGMGVDKNHVLLLRKAVYGLVQSPRLFYRQFAKYLESIGFKRCVLDGCLFTKRTDNKLQVLALHVDDGLIASSDPALLEQVSTELRSNWGVEEFNDLGYYLGFEFRQSEDLSELTMSSQSYVETLVERFGAADAKDVHTPMITGLRLDPKPEEKDIIDLKRYPYRQLVGSLLYLSVNARPDIAFATGVLARNLSNPTLMHWRAAKRVLSYLKTTKTLGIIFKSGSNGQHQVEVTTDADYASDVSRHSTYGYVTRINGNVTNWKSKLNRTKVDLSSCESELKGMIEGAKDGIFMQNLLQEMGEATASKYAVISDSQPAIKLCQNPLYHGRCKHLDVTQHFMRFEYDNHRTSLSYIPSGENVADLLTKALPRPLFEKLRAKIMEHVQRT